MLYAVPVLIGCVLVLAIRWCSSTHLCVRSVPGSVDATGRYTYPYTMSYIRFDGLVPGGRYTYRVKAGGDGAPWSDTFGFRVPTAGGAAAGPTRIATYGDMGHSHYNNMGNLHDDCAAGRIDAILHMGDHACE